MPIERMLKSRRDHAGIADLLEQLAAAAEGVAGIVGFLVSGAMVIRPRTRTWIIVSICSARCDRRGDGAAVLLSSPEQLT